MSGDALTIAHLDGGSDPHHFSGTFAFEERPKEVVLDVQEEDQGAGVVEPSTATYLIESSGGHLHLEESATITRPNPATRLVFEAEPLARVEAHEAGMGSIRLKALVESKTIADVRMIRYQWRWDTIPGHQIWDREV